ncbi:MULTISPECIES: hypothetical protein [Pseudoalteromonas]|uniref:hypothetical protein n=1 Tax=Pseudoalteromonas TaxID=53246 RepID=UPI00029B47E3|nr:MULTISPECIES: hypothetical protein [Pseudoalteromonas]AUJ71057.1 hypothetical protein PNC201_14015 [Pseudoalteromonas sp. NC201]MCG7552911.1 hypothetical protein [Pseudoalteromonas sp. Of11M-6]
MSDEKFKSINSKAEANSQTHVVGNPQLEQFQYQREALKADTQLNTQQMELGFVGKIIGSGDNAKMAVVFLTLFFMLSSIAVLVFTKDMSNSVTFQTVTLLMNVVSATLGYIFGQKSK